MRIEEPGSKPREETSPEWVPVLYGVVSALFPQKPVSASLACLMPKPAEKPKEKPGSLEITSVCTDTHQTPRKGVTVKISGPDSKKGITNEKGKFLFSPIKPGKYEISVSTNAVPIVVKNLDIPAGGSKTLTVWLINAIRQTIQEDKGIIERSSWVKDKNYQVDYKNDKKVEADCDYNTVVFHHSGPYAEKTPLGIVKKHLDNRGWSDIGYHFLITPDGKVYEGCKLGYKGSHVGGQNTGKIGILVMGDFQPGGTIKVGTLKVYLELPDLFFEDDPIPAQITRVVTLVTELKKYFPNLKKLGGHRDFDATNECPGNKLYNRLDEIRKKTSLKAP